MKIATSPRSIVHRAEPAAVMPMITARFRWGRDGNTADTKGECGEVDCRKDVVGGGGGLWAGEVLLNDGVSTVVIGAGGRADAKSSAV